MSRNTVGIQLSPKSKKLIAKLDKSLPELCLELSVEKEYIAEKQLVNWLKKDFELNKKDKTYIKNHFRIERLRASLIEDLVNSFLTPEEIENKKQKPPSRKTKFLFGLLALAGTILAICDGFDGVVSVLSMFSTLPATLVLGAGALFSVLSVIVFYGFDFIALSNNLGVQLVHSPSLIDVLLEQTKQIKDLRKVIDNSFSENDEQYLRDLLALVSMLKVRYDGMNDAREFYKNALNKTYLHSAKSATAAIAGILFFAGGFFSGQALALAITGVFIATATASSLPIVVTSMAVGLGAFSLYWFVERPGLENLLGRWCGLDKEKIDKFAGEEVIHKQVKALKNIEKKILSKLHDREEISYLQGGGVKKALVTPLPKFTANDKETNTFASNPNRFLRSHSTGNLANVGKTLQPLYP